MLSLTLSRSAMSLALTSLFFPGFTVSTDARKQNGDARLVQDQPLEISTVRGKRPDGRIAFNLTGRYRRGGKTIHLRTTTIGRARRKLAKRKNPDPLKPASVPTLGGMAVTRFAPQQEPAPVIQDDGGPGYDYYYSNSDISNSSGSVMVAATYQFEEPTNRNVLYMTVGGVTITLDLNTLEMLPLTEVDQQRLEEWANSEEAALALDTLMAIVEQGWNQPFEVLQNYYALAVLFETGSDSSARMQPKGSRKVVLHHAVRKLKNPNDAMSRPCSDQTIAAVNTFGGRTTSSALMKIVTPQGHQCCGWGNNCIRDRYNAPIYGAPCVNHDRCVAGQHIRSAVRCAPSLGRAILYVWWRNSEWGAYLHYDR